MPELVIPDNEKAGVRAASRYEPDLNPSYRELATHDGTTVLPDLARSGSEPLGVRSPTLLYAAVFARPHVPQTASNHSAAGLLPVAGKKLHIGFSSGNEHGARTGERIYYQSSLLSRHFNDPTWESKRQLVTRSVFVTPMSHRAQVVPDVTQVETLLDVLPITTIVFDHLTAVSACRRWNFRSTKHFRLTLCIVEESVVRRIQSSLRREPSFHRNGNPVTKIQHTLYPGSDSQSPRGDVIYK